jgi:hypothetical protein
MIYNGYNQNLEDDTPGEGNVASSVDDDMERHKSAVSATGTVSDAWELGPTLIY